MQGSVAVADDLARQDKMGAARAVIMTADARPFCMLFHGMSLLSRCSAGAVRTSPDAPADDRTMPRGRRGTVNDR
jgi:hypothetical protein